MTLAAAYGFTDPHGDPPDEDNPWNRCPECFAFVRVSQDTEGLWWREPCKRCASKAARGFGLDPADGWPPLTGTAPGLVGL